MDNRQPMSSRSVNISPQKSPKKRIASKQLDPNPTSSTQPSSSAPSTRPTRINEEESAAAWDAELAQLYKDMETMPKKEALKKLGVSGGDVDSVPKGTTPGVAMAAVEDMCGSR